MAKPKQNTLVKVNPPDSIHVYTSQPEKEIAGIRAIEGVNSIIFISNPIFVYTDPHYNVNEIAEEIKDVLTVNIPDVFRE